MRSLAIIQMLSMERAGGVQLHGRARHVLLALWLAAGCAAPAASPQRPAPTRPEPTPGATWDYGRLESEVLAALNRARTDPRATARSLDEVAGYYSGTLLKRPTWSVAIRTTEGVAAARDHVAARSSKASSSTMACPIAGTA